MKRENRGRRKVPGRDRGKPRGRGPHLRSRFHLMRV